MERSTPVRKPHTSTADLLTWSENPPADSSADASASGSRPAMRSHQPSDGISKVLFGGQVTEEEAESLNKRSDLDANLGCTLFTSLECWGSRSVCWVPRSLCLRFVAEDHAKCTFFGLFGEYLSDRVVDVLSSRVWSAGVLVQFVGSPGEIDVVSQSVSWFFLKGVADRARKPCSGPKLKEMTGSGIFAADGENGETESSSTTATPNKTGLRIYQQAVSAMSQISFGADGSVSPKKPTSLTEVAKQRELSGTLESETDARMKKHLSDAKSKELSGHDIFAPPPEITPRSLPKHSDLKDSKDSVETPRRNPPVFESNITFSEETPEAAVKTAKKICNQKFAELTGNDIFKGDASSAAAEKPLSSAKLKEMSGSDIFADGKQTSRDYFGGVRKPPGGESSIALV
ncbi:hypothetical protein ACLOJK_016242 [Asimina triloba]